MIKVSVLIPAYQAQKYLSRCIESILNQTLKEIEIIIINDGSTDQTQQIMNYYQASYSFIKTDSQSNQGIVRTKEAALKKASGEYVLFMDDDDWLAPSALEKLYEHAKKEDADLVYYNFYEVIGNVGYPQIGIQVPFEEFKTHLIDRTITSLYHCTLWRKLIRKEYLDQLDFNKFPNINYWEDWVIGVLLTVFQPKIAFLNEYLYFWNRHPESTTAFVRDNCSTDIIAAFKSVIQYFKELEIYEQHKASFKQRLEEHTNWMEACREQNIECANQMSNFYRKWIENYEKN